jgi:ABC-type uncharacterized transport system fused permease/ATPase subunit
MEVEKLPVKPTLKRIDSAYIWHEFQHIFHFEKGFLYTMKGLMLQPGKTVREFILEDRTKAVKPVIFILVISTVFALTFKYIGDDMYFFSTEQFHNRKIIVIIYEWFNHNIGYSFIILGFHLTFWTKLFFRKHPYNFWELLITFCYYIGQALFIIFIFTVLLKYTHLSFKEGLSKYIGFAYLFWATGQFFGEKKIINYVKSTFAVILGGLSFTLITEVFVQLIDLLIEKVKH